MFILFIFTSSSFALISQKEIVEDVTKSLENNPELWIDTGMYMIYFKNQSDLKKGRKLLYPEHDENAEIVFMYNILSGYSGGWIEMKKPFSLKT